MKKAKHYDLKEIYKKLINNEIPQSFVNDVLSHYSVVEQTEEEKIFANTATTDRIFFRNANSL